MFVSLLLKSLRLKSLPVAAATLLALTAVAAAQDYPTKPVRIIVPFPPGAINDTVGRMVGTHLSNRLGKQFVVENRAGAGGVVGAELVANAPKDGHTLLVVSLAITVNPWLYTLPYDHGKAWAQVAVVATAPNVIAVHPDLPAQSARERDVGFVFQHYAPRSSRASCNTAPRASARSCISDRSCLS